MKSKCSFILKAGLSLVLVLLLLFSTMATGIAAVVEELAATGGQYNKYWKGNYFFRVPDNWDLSTNPVVQVVTTRTSDVNTSMHVEVLGTMTIVGTTSNSRLYNFYANNINHSNWNVYEWFAFIASPVGYGSGSFALNTVPQYTNPLDFNAYTSGSLLFSSTDTGNGAVLSHAESTSGRGVIQKAQDFYIYTNGSSSALGGSLRVDAYSPKDPDYNGENAIEGFNITVDAEDVGAHQQYVTAVEGTKVTLTETPASGYRFEGFFDAATGGNEITSSYYVNGTKSVYARFLQEYTIAYNPGANGSGTIASGTKVHGQNFTLSDSKFSRVGYKQTGWSTSDGGGKAYDLGESYTGNAGLTLYPYWEPALEMDTATITLYKDRTGGVMAAGFNGTATVTITTDAGDNSGTVSAVSSNGSAVTASITNPNSNTSTLNLTALDYGTSDVTVTYTVGGNSFTKTVTVNVVAYEPDVYVYLTVPDFDSNKWSAAYIVALDNSEPETSVTGTTYNQMTWIGSVGDDKVYAYKFTRAQYNRINKIIFNDQGTKWGGGWNQTEDITAPFSTTFYELGTTGGDGGHRNTITSALSFVRPDRITLSAVDVDINDSATVTAATSGYNTATGGVYFKSSNEDIFTLTSSLDADLTDNSYSTTVNCLDPNSSSATITAYAYPAVSGGTVTYIRSDEVASYIGLSTSVVPNSVATTYNVTVTQRYRDAVGGAFTDGTKGSVTADYFDNTNQAATSVIADGSSIAAIKNKDVKLTATANSGYKFLGWSTNGTDIISADNPYTIPSLSSGTTVYALFASAYDITLFKSYAYEDGSFRFVSAPPKTVRILRTINGVADTVAETYTFSSSADRTSATVGGQYNAFTYGNGTPITVGIGDKVQLVYSTLSSSDAIQYVKFDNSKEYSTSAPTAEEDYSVAYRMLSPTDVVIDQANHTATFVMGAVGTAMNERTGEIEPPDPGTTSNTVYDRKNITIDLNAKQRISFKSETGLTSSGMNTGGYYYIGETVSAITVSQTSEAYEIGTPVFYTSNGKIITDNGSMSGDSKYFVVDSMPLIWSGDATNGTLSGAAMPAYDVVVDMKVTRKIYAFLDNSVLSDVMEERTDITSPDGDEPPIGTITAYTLDADDNTDARLDSSGKHAATLLAKGTKIRYSFAFSKSETLWDGDAEQYYMFLGWYKGTADAPTISAETRISTKTTFDYILNEDTYVWAVATRNLYINGNMFDSSGNYTKVRQATWQYTAHNIPMEYDYKNDCYVYVINEINTYSENGNKNYEFVIYDSEGGTSANHSLFDQVISYDKNANGMQFGKISDGDKNGYYQIGSDKIESGWNVPITIKFYPKASDSWYSIEATQTFHTIRVSDGYRGIDTDSDTNHTIAYTKEFGTYRAYASSDNPSHLGTPTTLSPTKELQVSSYLVKQKNAEVRLSRAVTSDYRVSHFVFYNYNNTNDKEETVYSMQASYDSTNDYYYVDFTMGEDDLYIVPIIELKSATMTVVFDATELNTDRWGDLVACYAWYANNTKAYGDFPGQLMVPTSGSWTANFAPSIKIGDVEYEIAGISFTNYFSGDTSTWLGCSGVCSTIDASADDCSSWTVSSAGLIDTYNKIPGNGEGDFAGQYGGWNCKVQTYDYREPITMYDSIKETLEEGDSFTLTFAVKKGDVDAMKYRHSELTWVEDPDSNLFSGIGHYSNSGVTYSAASGAYKFNASDFKPLKDSTGQHYTDLNGTNFDEPKTPTYYIIAKGQVRYTGSSLMRVFNTGKHYQMATSRSEAFGHGWSSAVNYSYDYNEDGVNDFGSVDMTSAVQWYIYDASGNYITNVLSSAYSEMVQIGADDTGNAIMQRYVAYLLEQLDYPVDLKAVAIAYDSPRYCYGEDDGIENTGSSFDTFRFAGQWLASTNLTPVKISVNVGIEVDGQNIISESNTEDYGRAYASYDTSRDPGHTYVNEKIVAEDGSYVQVALADMNKFTPVSLSIGNPSDQSFIGWYYYDSSGKFTKVKDAPAAGFYPSSTKDITYTAMFKVVASYRFEFTDRTGKRQTFVSDEITLRACEIAGYDGNNNKAGVPTYIWSDDIKTRYNADGEDVVENPYLTALKTVAQNISSYQYTLYWPTVTGPTTVSVNGSSQTLSDYIKYDTAFNYCLAKADCEVAKYTVTVNEENTTHNGITRTNSTINVPAGNVFSFNGTFRDRDGFTVPDYTPTAAGFLYYSSDPEGHKILTRNFNYGLVITHDTVIYAQYDNALGETPDPWMPQIESVAQSRAILSSSDDTVYLDYNLYFANTDSVMIDSMEDGEIPYFGLVVIYNQSDQTTAPASITDDNLRKLIRKMINLGYTSATYGGNVICVYAYDEKEYVSNRNRSNFTVKMPYVDALNTAGSKYTSYAFVAEKPLSGSSNVYISDAFNSNVYRAGTMTASESFS